MSGFCLKVMIHFLRGILHSLYENLAQRYDTKECHIGWKQRLMRNMLLPLMTKQVLCFNMPKKQNTCSSFQNITYLLMMQGSLLGICSTAWGQSEPPCESKVFFPPVHVCFEDMQHRSKRNPSVWAWCDSSKLNYLWYVCIGKNAILHRKNDCMYISTNRHIYRNETVMTVVHEACAEGKKVTWGDFWEISALQRNCTGWRRSTFIL